MNPGARQKTNGHQEGSIYPMTGTSDKNGMVKGLGRARGSNWAVTSLKTQGETEHYVKEVDLDIDTTTRVM